MGWRVSRSHKRILPSPPPVASVFPSGLKARVTALRSCVVMGWPSGLRVSRFHKMRFLSNLLLDASLFPSGLKAILNTASPWLANERPTGLSVATSQRIILSALAEASVLPSGLNATKLPPRKYDLMGVEPYASAVSRLLRASKVYGSVAALAEVSTLRDCKANNRAESRRSSPR